MKDIFNPFRIVILYVPIFRKMPIIHYSMILRCWMKDLSYHSSPQRSSHHIPHKLNFSFNLNRLNSHFLTFTPSFASLNKDVLADLLTKISQGYTVLWYTVVCPHPWEIGSKTPFVGRRYTQNIYNLTEQLSCPVAITFAVWGMTAKLVCISFFTISQIEDSFLP